MYAQPSAVELLEAVRAFLEERALPELQGRTAFHARVAINALAIVKRELEQAPAAQSAELTRLRGLLGTPAPARDAQEASESALDRLNRELCRRIRGGAIAVNSPALADHLRQSTLATVAVDQPTYSGYRRALEES